VWPGWNQSPDGSLAESGCRGRDAGPLAGTLERALSVAVHSPGLENVPRSRLAAMVGQVSGEPFRCLVPLGAVFRVARLGQQAGCLVLGDAVPDDAGAAAEVVGNDPVGECRRLGAEIALDGGEHAPLAGIVGRVEADHESRAGSSDDADRTAPAI